MRINEVAQRNLTQRRELKIVPSYVDVLGYK